MKIDPIKHDDTRTANEMIDLASKAVQDIYPGVLAECVSIRHGFVITQDTGEKVFGSIEVYAKGFDPDSFVGEQTSTGFQRKPSLNKKGKIVEE